MKKRREFTVFLFSTGKLFDNYVDNLQHLLHNREMLKNCQETKGANLQIFL